MSDMNARTLRIITLVLGMVVLWSPLLAQTAIWPMYHFNADHTGQNPNSKDITDPSTLNLIWVFPRIDSNESITEANTIVDDTTGINVALFSTTGHWPIDKIADAYGSEYHHVPVVTDATKQQTATWVLPANLPEGKFQIYLWVPPVAGTTRVANYSVYDASGTKRDYKFDQTSSGGAWKLLSADYFTFTKAGANERVELTSFVSVNDGGSDTYSVIADAVKFVPALVDTGQQIYTSPASADLDFTTLPDPADPTKTIQVEGAHTCVYVGTVEPVAGILTSDGQTQTRDMGAIYCIYGITPTIQDPNTMNDGPDKDRYLKIAKYLGKPKWRYPRTGQYVNDRLPIEGPIAGGIYSSPTLARVEGVGLVTYVAAMDRQLYALNATTGELLWKGPGITVSEDVEKNVRDNWNVTDSREDAFGGSFHFTDCGSNGANTCTWRFETKDQDNVKPSGDGLSYAVYAWMPGPGGTNDIARSKTATYEITYQDNTGNPNAKATVTVNQSVTSNMNAWVRIGGSYFNPSQVVLKNTAVPEPPPVTPPVTPPGPAAISPAADASKVASDYVVVADAVMFVPDTIDGLGYSSPVTDADPLAAESATNVFAMSLNGRAMAFQEGVNASHTHYVAKLNWVFPAVRTKRTPDQTQVDQPSWGSIGSSPAFSSVGGDRLYVATLDGTVRCLDGVKAGPPTQRWVFPPDPKNTDESLGGFTSSPTLGFGRVFIGSTDGIFYCLDQNTGWVVKDNEKVPVWQYPAKNPASTDPNIPPTANLPLGSFKYSTPAVASLGGVERVWCGSSDGHIYSFLATDGTRLYLNDDGTQHNAGPWYSEPSLLAPIQGSVALDGQGGLSGSSVMYVGDMNGVLHWRDAGNGSTNNWQYAGWNCPEMLFSSPNISNTSVLGKNDVSWVYVGSADGHLFAFTRKGGGWGGGWQGGQWPFPGSSNHPEDNMTTAAPETDIQFDILSQGFYNASDSFVTTKLDPTTTDQKTGITTTDATSINQWTDDKIVSKAMKVYSGTTPATELDINTELTKQAKLRRLATYFPPNIPSYFPVGRVPSGTEDQIYFEWGEKIYMAVWNLPESRFLYGSGSNVCTFTMTNASTGESAGSMFKISVGDPRSYTVVVNNGGVYSPLTVKDSDPVVTVRRSYVLATISLDGTGGELPSPGPGWVLSVQIRKKSNDSNNAVVTTVTLPLAKLTLKSGVYEPLLVQTQKNPNTDPNEAIKTSQFVEASIGINNPLAIRDDQGGSVGWWTGDHPTDAYRFKDDVHTNGNARYTTNTGTGGGYNFFPINPPPMLDLGMRINGTTYLPVPHGTSSREAPLGIMDRSAMGLIPRPISPFRIDSADLKFRNWPYAVESQPVDPSTGNVVNGVTYGMRFPWDGGPGSVDYPDIFKRYQTYQQISTDLDPTIPPIPPIPPCKMLGVDGDPNAPIDKRYENSWLRADTVLVSVDVPRFQPANTSTDDGSGLSGYAKTMTAYIDTNNNNSLDMGNYVNGKPTTHQDTYRRFRVQVKVPPDPKLEVDEQLIDVGSAPHGLGEPWNSVLNFSAYNSDPRIRQWFKTLTIKNGGNVNLYNIRINQALDLVSDQASPGALLPGGDITSSLDPAPLKAYGLFGSEPFFTTTAKGGDVFLGYTISKPRVGDPDPTIMTVPDRRKWDVVYASKTAAADAIAGTGWAVSPEKAEPLPVTVSVRVPLTQPIGTYQSWDSVYRIPYVAVFSDTSGTGKLDDGDGKPKPVAMPSFQLKTTVRESQLTGGVTPTTLPQIDYLPNSADAPTEMLPRVGDATPAAFRDLADGYLGVHVFWSSNGSGDRMGPFPKDDAERAKFAGAPWFINHAVLGYGSDGWSTAKDGFHWWTTGKRIPKDQWAVPAGKTPADLNIMPWDSGGGASDLYSVKHYSPCIGENLAVSRKEDFNRRWLAWAGTADVRDPITNKISQINLIFYTDATHGVDESSRSIWAIEHDPIMVKRSPCPVPDANNMWMFWQGGSSGNWSIYYSLAQDKKGVFDTTRVNWSPDMKLRTPDCMASVGSPNALLRHWWADIRGTDEKDFPDAYREVLADSKESFDVVYAGTSKITRNADIMLSRYIAAYPDSAFPRAQPSRVAQPMPRVFDEKLMRDPKFGFYTSKHLVWWRAARGGAFGTDQWGDNGSNTIPNSPYVRVVFPDGYDDGTLKISAGSWISATDGSAWVNATSVAGAVITPEIDDATGIYTYKYAAKSAADIVLGQMLIDYSAGIIRFTKPLKEVQVTAAGPTKGAYITPEVHADYTPQAWRITTDPAADGSPRAFIEHTSMIDPNKGVMVPGLDPKWPAGKPAPVDRMWVFWRKTGTAVDSSTIFYTTMRIGADLNKIRLPSGKLLPTIPMDVAKGSVPPSANLHIYRVDAQGNVLGPSRGPWEVDRTGTKIYFSEVDEGYRSMLTADNYAALGASSADIGTSYPDAIAVTYTDANGKPVGSDQKPVPLYDVSWITELPEQSLFGFAADANVNEGSIYAFADPRPMESGTSVRLLSSKIWVFWTSTRGGNSDLFWETLSPNFWAR